MIVVACNTILVTTIGKYMFNIVMPIGLVNSFFSFMKEFTS